MSLAQAAVADRSGALDAAAIEAAVGRSGLDFSASAHGRRQRELIDALGQGGRLAVAIGVAGSGKSTLLAPLVDAWQRDGRRVYGAALAWRQSDDLAGAGIPDADRAAYSVFLGRVTRGQVRLDRVSVVVVDELGLLGTRQLLELLRVQAATGCQVVAVGDPKQCQSIEAEPVIELLRRALGANAIPEHADDGPPANGARAGDEPDVPRGQGGGGPGAEARRRHRAGWCPALPTST